jgi:hypothetical protein
MADIVDSVIECGRTNRLAAVTAMHDLVVAVRPVPEDVAIDVVLVRSPSSHIPVEPGAVLIQHRSTTGFDDEITRPADEAVALFWRFMIEKFGVSPA